MGHPVIMGRKTFDSIGKPLPGRETIVLTRDPAYRQEGVLVAPDLPAALRLAEAAADRLGADEIVIAGGGEIYRQTLDKAVRIEQLAAWITANSCTDKVFFCNSGAEANEAAIKLARKHGHVVRGIDGSAERGPLILTAQASFHGRTLAAVTATGQPKYHQGFEPMVHGFRHFPYNDTAAFEALLRECEAEGPRVAAVLLEPLQGEGGVNPGDPAFFRRVRELCDQHNILLIFDEVQVGVGRTGCLWGYQKLGVEPDAITLAKGLGGGVPIGALCVKAKADLLQPGEHASTFGGNPLACRAALTVAEELSRRNLPAHVAAMGELLQQQSQGSGDFEAVNDALVILETLRNLELKDLDKLLIL
jgi:acetylornithine/succinyldiaminopimelate/putrescine aminotransferase